MDPGIRADTRYSSGIVEDSAKANKQDGHGDVMAGRGVSANPTGTGGLVSYWLDGDSVLGRRGESPRSISVYPPLGSILGLLGEVWGRLG